MARTILAAVAALCALAAVSCVPILGEAPQPQLSEQQLLAADTLETIVQELQGLLDKIQETSDDAEVALKNADQAVEAEAQQLDNKLTARVQELVDEANQTLVDVSECVNGLSAALADVVKNFLVDTRQCIVDPTKDLRTALQTLRDAALEVNALLRNATDGVEECKEADSSREKRLCQLRIIGPIAVKTALLQKSIVATVTKITTTRITFVSNIASCTNARFESALRQGADIVDATISCIKNKQLNPSS